MPQFHRIMTLAVLLVPMLATDSRGQRLLEMDGVELHGEARLLQPGGGTCNVLETDTSYESRKENDGAPMDIWRLDFTVRNRSGRWLDHLIAQFQIASEMPECTNWDVSDSLAIQYPFLPVEWGDSIGFIQESGRNVVSPGQSLTDTTLMIVLRGDPEPHFSSWYMDVDFAVNPPRPGTAAGAADRPPAVRQPVAATAEQESLFWQSIKDSTNPAEFEAYLTQFPNGVFRALAEARLAALRERLDATGTAADLGRTSLPGFTGIEEPSEQIGFCGLPWTRPSSLSNSQPTIGLPRKSDGTRTALRTRYTWRLIASRTYGGTTVELRRSHLRTRYIASSSIAPTVLSGLFTPSFSCTRSGEESDRANTKYRRNSLTATRSRSNAFRPQEALAVKVKPEALLTQGAPVIHRVVVEVQVVASRCFLVGGGWIPPGCWGRQPFRPARWGSGISGRTAPPRRGGLSGGSATDPQGPASGSSRVSRGGAWYNSAGFVRVPLATAATPAFTTICCAFAC